MKRTGYTLVLTAIALPLLSCGHQLGMRHFAGPIQPATGQQSAELSIGDDRSITYTQGRLEVNLRPLTDEILNRQLAAHSPDKSSFYLNPYEMELNPYTYSDWNPPEQSWAPARFTVFSLKVKNYEFPKVWLNPEKISLTAANGRQYQALSLAAMVEYYWPYAVGYGGNVYLKTEERKDILQETMYKTDEFVFSGQESIGLIVFPPLHRDVSSFVVAIEDLALRFDFRDEPVETVNIAYSFDRDVYKARKPRPAEQ